MENVFLEKSKISWKYADIYSKNKTIENIVNWLSFCALGGLGIWKSIELFLGKKNSECLLPLHYTLW